MIKSARSLTKYILSLACVLSLAACSSSPTKIPENLSDATLFSKGQSALRHGDYYDAIDNFKALESRYPFGPFSTQGQLDLAYAYLKNDNPQEAHAAASRFIRLHPDHPNADYAYYIRGLSSYMSNEGFVERYLPIDASERDPGPALQSFNEFSELLSRYPNSPYSADARQRMVALKDRMADHVLHIANYYMKRHAYVAAISRGNEIVSNYQQTPAVEPALGVIIEGYQHLGLTAPANQTLAVLKKNFPHSKLINAQGKFIGYKIFSDVNPSFWSMITFGLIGNNAKKSVIGAIDVPSPPKEQVSK